MTTLKKLFALTVLCASVFLALPHKSAAADAPTTLAQTYDQCMSWCMTQYDFFTCDEYCSRYADAQ